MGDEEEEASDAMLLISMPCCVFQAVSDSVEEGSVEGELEVLSEASGVGGESGKKSFVMGG